MVTEALQASNPDLSGKDIELQEGSKDEVDKEGPLEMDDDMMLDQVQGCICKGNLANRCSNQQDFSHRQG